MILLKMEGIMIEVKIVVGVDMFGELGVEMLGFVNEFKFFCMDI